VRPLRHQPHENTLISRRTAICTAAGLLLPFVALGLTEETTGNGQVGGRACRSSPESSSQDEPELCIFKGRERDTVLVAVLLGSPPGQSVRIHVGERNWLASVAASSEADSITTAGEGRLYSGTVVGRGSQAARRKRAVVLETHVRRDRVSPTLDIWAEVLGPGESRRRVASPFVAAVLRRHRPLASDFHRGSPTNDTRLRESFAEQVQLMAAAHVSDSSAHAKRLAAALLPDVIPFRPDRPVGFSFAAQNGRQPNDQVDSVVAAVLSGAICPHPVLPPYPLVAEFPYFVPLRRTV
jgi:hypothetical protein